MKWMRERDLLIAQTMAFVQSVTGKTPEAEKMVTASVALLSVETSETIHAAAALPDIESLLAETPPGAQGLALHDDPHDAAAAQSSVADLHPLVRPNRGHPGELLLRPGPGLCSIVGRSQNVTGESWHALSD